MHIALVTTWPPAHCGIGTYTRDLALTLMAMGHKVTILAETLDTSHEGHSKDAPFVRRVWNRKSPYAAPFGLGQVTAAIQQLQPDAVHVQHEFGLFPRSEELLRLAAGQKTFITFHTIEPAPKFLSCFNEPRANICAISHTMAGLAALATRGWATRHIPHGVTPQANAVVTTTNTFLCPGFVSPSKGHTEILEGFARYLDRGGTHSLAIAGSCRDAQYADKLRERAFKLGLDTPRYRFVDRFFTDEALTRLIKSASAVVLGHAAKQSPLSASGQVAQAISAHVPIVAKDVAIYREAPGLFWRTPNELALALDAVVRPAVVSTLRGQSEKALDERAWGTVAANHIRLYEGVWT